MERLLECAGQVLGTELTPVQTQALERCCAAAKLRCLSGLGELTGETEPVALQACALMAAGLFLEGSPEAGEVSSFTAGRLSVTTGSGAGRAQKLKQAALDLMAPLRGGGAAFLGVRG